MNESYEVSMESGIVLDATKEDAEDIAAFLREPASKRLCGAESVFRKIGVSVINLELVESVTMELRR